MCKNPPSGLGGDLQTKLEGRKIDNKNKNPERKNRSDFYSSPLAPSKRTNYSSTDVAVSDIGMQTSLNDCMYCNMYRYNYTVTIDLDEVIVPLVENKYRDMLTNHMGHEPWISTLTFSGQVFYKTFTGVKDEAQESTYPLTSSPYTYSIPDKIRPKSFFNPRTCLGAFSHYCLLKMPGSQPLHKLGGGKMARVHHYRKQCYKQPGRYTADYCRQMDSDKQLVSRMLDFQGELYRRYSVVVNQLGLTDRTDNHTITLD